jgi:hypothetical protein
MKANAMKRRHEVFSYLVQRQGVRLIQIDRKILSRDLRKSV